MHTIHRPAAHQASDAQPVVAGFYDELVSASTLPNLRRGDVVVRYGEHLPASVLTHLRRWYDRDPESIVVAPASGAPRSITLEASVRGTASKHAGGDAIAVARCTAFDAAAFSRFVRQHRRTT